MVARGLNLRDASLTLTRVGGFPAGQRFDTLILGIVAASRGAQLIYLPIG